MAVVFVMGHLLRIVWIGTMPSRHREGAQYESQCAGASIAGVSQRYPRAPRAAISQRCDHRRRIL